jgi:3-phosphoshikimate 1-carboxyvinyltransferase
MKILVHKSEIGGAVKAPPSKSYTIRALMCAALAKGQSEIKNPLLSDDTEAASRVLEQVGITVKKLNSDLWKVKGGKFQTSRQDLFCGDSAATIRFMSAICALIPGTSRLTAGPSLMKRPIITLVEALRQWGIDIRSSNDSAPVVVNGGIFTGGLTELPGNISSQYVSALLLIAPLARSDTVISLTSPLESVPYVTMTIECLKRFGIEVESSKQYQWFEIHPQTYKTANYTIEADWSSSSYILGLGVLAGETVVENINLDSLQADKSLVYFLKDMGAEIITTSRNLRIKKSRLQALKADLTDCIDLLPTMSVLAALANGTSEFTGIERARLKESNRVSSVREGLERTGIKVLEKPDRLIIEGGIPRSAVIEAHNDHRIAMAFSLMGAACGGITIEGAECVSKTYPEYWKTLKSLGVKLDEQQSG